MELCFIYFHGYFNIYLNLVLYYSIICTRMKLSRPDICNLCNIVAYILMKSLRNTLVKVSSKYGQYFLRLARTNKQTSFMKVIPPLFSPLGIQISKNRWKCIFSILTEHTHAKFRVFSSSNNVKLIHLEKSTPSAFTRSGIFFEKPSNIHFFIFYEDFFSKVS